MSEKVIAIRQADGSYYPIMKEGETGSKTLQLTTVRDEQTTVKVNLYKMTENSDEEPKYMDTLLIENLNTHPQGEATLDLDLKLDENGMVNAEIKDKETGTTSNTKVSLITLAENTLDEIPDFTLSENSEIEDFNMPDDLDASTEIDSEETLPEETELFEPTADDISEDKNEKTENSVENEKEEPILDENLPEIDTDFTAKESESDDILPDSQIDQNKTPDTFDFNDLPDFDDFGISNSNEIDQSLTDKEEEKDDFNDAFADKPQEETPLEDSHPSQLLYDESLSDKVDEIEMKQKRNMHIPIIICIICAILCIIAVIFIFIYSPFPSKKDQVPNTISENIIQTPAPIPEKIEPEVAESTPEAISENTIEIVQEDTVPEPVEPVETPKDVKYRLKWGDTLWDLSESYYRNPWLYTEIAEHNNIKNPDWIIAGTDINIPGR